MGIDQAFQGIRISCRSYLYALWRSQKHISLDEAKHNCQNSAGFAFLVATFQLIADIISCLCKN